MKHLNLRPFKTIFSFMAALLFSVGLTACDSTREVATEADAGAEVEVSETSVTDIDTTQTTK